MKTRQRTKPVLEGKYAAQVEVQIVENDTEWSPYLSVEDAGRLDDVRTALRREDVAAAARLGRIFTLESVSG